MAEIFTEADKNAPNPSMEGQENTQSQGVYASVKSRVGSFLGRRFGRGTDSSNGPDGEESLRRAWNEGYGGSVGNTVRAVSFLVAGLIAGTTTWAIASGTSLPVSRMTSKALHAVWYEDPTIYDQYMSVHSRNASLSTENVSLKELSEREKQEAERLKAEEKKLSEEKTKLQTTNKTLVEKNKKLTAKVVKLQASQKSKSKLAHKGKSKSRMLVDAKKVKSWKEKAIKNQKVISAKLEELLRWQGRAGKLANYGVREWVFDSEAKTKAYVLKEQPRSLSIIKQKIAALKAKGLVEKAWAKTHHIKGFAKYPTKPSHVKGCPPRRGIVRKTTVPKSLSKAEAIKPVSGWAQDTSMQKIEDIPKKVVPSTSSLTEQVQKILPEMETPVIGPKTHEGVVPNNELDAMHGTSSLQPSITVPVLVSANGDTLNVPIEDMHRNSGWVPSGIALLMQSSPTQTVADKAPVTKKDSHKESSAVPTGLENVWNTPKPSSSFKLEKGSGLTPSNITEEKLTAFLDKANRKLRSVGATDPRVKDASFTMERVVKNGFPGWLITMKYKGGENHFILSTEKASWNYKNFQIVASPKRASNWAVHEATEREKRLEKKMAKQEKRGK